MNPKIEESWKKILWSEFNSPYFDQLKQFLIAEKSQYVVFPPGPLIFNAFNLTPFDQVKVVIIGQDPYPNEGQAEGLCFSVPEGIELPRSLVNIYQEIQNDLGIMPRTSGSLTHWARQGVLLLNATLTVRAHCIGSHQNKGWEQFTDSAIRALSQQRDHIVFLLWGNYAKKKIELIDPTKHAILTAAHPSPLSANKGFFGCKHFSQTNTILKSWGKTEINW
ncbi:MAG: uracil-DNA glycosylase [Bacteroidales bacterium]|nr:uracil-DNA glycosylase [Bacteroidales bacterium]